MTDQELRLEHDKAMQMLDNAGVPRTRAGQQMPLSDRVYYALTHRAPSDAESLDQSRLFGPGHLHEQEVRE